MAVTGKAAEHAAAAVAVDQLENGAIRIGFPQEFFVHYSIPAAVMAHEGINKPQRRSSRWGMTRASARTSAPRSLFSPSSPRPAQLHTFCASLAASPALTELLGAVGIEYDSTQGSTILKAMEVRPFLFPLLLSLSSLSHFLLSFLPRVLSVSFLLSFSFSVFSFSCSLLLIPSCSVCLFFYV